MAVQHSSWTLCPGKVELRAMGKTCVVHPRDSVRAMAASCESGQETSQAGTQSLSREEERTGAGGGVRWLFHLNWNRVGAFGEEKPWEVDGFMPRAVALAPPPAFGLHIGVT